MRKLFLISFIICSQFAFAGGGTTPKAPAQVSSGLAQSYIDNYKIKTHNYFAYGYLLDINQAKGLSTTGVRVYNGIESDMSQNMVMAPLDKNYSVTSGPCSMQADDRLCPKICDIVSDASVMQVQSGEVGKLVNACMECNKYEAVNAFVVFTPVLETLSGAGYKYVRIYNGMDDRGGRFIVYVPIDSRGKEVITPQMWVGDYTNVLSNCKYP